MKPRQKVVEYVVRMLFNINWEENQMEIQYIIQTLACFLGFLIVVYMVNAIMSVRHYPGDEMDAETKKRVDEFGLIHFTFHKNIESIRKYGLMPDDDKKMGKKEGNFVWCFLGDPACFEQNLLHVRTKGDRKYVDTVVIIKAGTLVDPLLMKKKEKGIKYIVHRGVIHPAFIEVMSIAEYRQRYLSEKTATA